jgi:Flp pilus assembly protein TadG
VLKMLKGSRRRHHDGREAGAVATEFALLMAFLPLPIFAFGIVDYGEFMGQATNLSAIMRGAAEYARARVVQGNAPPTADDLQTLLGAPAEIFTPPPSSFCTCADNTQVTCPSPGDNNPCAANTDTRVLKYVAVSGAQTYSPIISGTWSFPSSVNARTVLRTQ